MAGGLKDEIGKSMPFESIEQEALLNCLRTADRLTHSAAVVLKPAGLTPTQYNVLRILRGSRPRALCCNEIAAMLIVRDADLTRLLDRLQQRGLVHRQRGAEDRRHVQIAITDAGLDLLRSLDEPMRTLHTRLLGHMGVERLKLLSELLEQARLHTRQEQLNTKIEVQHDADHSI